MSARQRFEVYRYAVVAAALIAAAAFHPTEWHPSVALPMAGLATLALQFPLRISLTHKVSLATAVFFAAALLLPAPLAAAVAAVSELLSGSAGVARKAITTRTPPPPAAVVTTMAFNGAHAYLVVLATGGVLAWGGKSALVVTGAALVMHLGNRLAVTLAVALRNEVSWRRVLGDSQGIVSFPAAAQFLLGYLFVTAVDWQPAVLPLAVVPAGLVYVSLQRSVQLKQETIRAVERMADMVDRRDPYTAQHSRRVSEYAVQLAHRLGFSREDIELLRLAGAVHDLGKIAVPDAVLLKPGRLTDEERLLMEAHPRTGYEILAEFREYAKVRELVLTHHERYAGGGYPSGLEARSLPLIAQVLPVADTFDAMTSARPYRDALPAATAIAELERGAGVQWNPRIVEAAVEIFGERPALPTGTRLAAAPR